MLTPNIDLQNKSILITGAAGFIGADLVMELLRDTDAVKIVGLDSMSDYYDVSIKEYRLAEIDKIAKQKNDSQWIFVKGSIADHSFFWKEFFRSIPLILWSTWRHRQVSGIPSPIRMLT